MNEARSSGPVIDRDAAAALIDPLTDLVIRAGAAILAVNRVAMKIDGKVGRLAGDGGGSGCRPDHRRWSRTAGSGGAGVIRRARSSGKAALCGSFFLVDPLDGTKEFVAGRDEFTVNLALVTEGTPLLGIIGAPALGLVWRGLVGRGAERLTIGMEPSGGGRADPYPRLPAKLAPPGSRPSAARTAMTGLKPSSRRGRARPGSRSVRRSNSAEWRKAKPTSIPASLPPPNGMSRRATRS